MRIQVGWLIIESMKKEQNGDKPKMVFGTIEKQVRMIGLNGLNEWM